MLKEQREDVWQNKADGQLAGVNLVLYFVDLVVNLAMLCNIVLLYCGYVRVLH